MKSCRFVLAGLLAAILLLTACEQREDYTNNAVSPESSGQEESVPSAVGKEEASPEESSQDENSTPESSSQLEEDAGQDDVEDRIAAAARQVTDAIVGTHDFTEEGMVPWTDDRQAANFLLMLGFEAAGSEEDSLYSYFFRYDGENCLHIDASAANWIPVRTLGLPEDWAFDPVGMAVEYDSEAEEYVTGGGFDLGSGWQAENRSVAIEENDDLRVTTVTVDFTAAPGFPDAISHVSGQMVYTLQPHYNVPYLQLEEVIISEAPRDFDLIVPGLPSAASLRWYDAAAGYEFTTEDSDTIQQVYELMRDLVIYADTPSTDFSDAAGLRYGCFTLVEFYGPEMEDPFLTVKLQPFSVEWQGETYGPWATENEYAIAGQLAELWKANSRLWN